MPNVSRLTPILWCRSCRRGFALILRLEHCPSCGHVADWSEDSPTPRFPFALSRKDWCVLKAIGIDPEMPIPNWTR